MKQCAPGTLYGTGVGPGDPKFMTLLAVETIRKCPVIAVPASSREKAVSYRIAAGVVENLDDKLCLVCSIPMTKDQMRLDAAYENAAEEIIRELEQGKDVAYLVLGDPTIYASYIYIHRIVRDRGYCTKIISGVPSFCAAAARLNDSLCDRTEQLHIIPSGSDVETALAYHGTKVLMKTASGREQVRRLLKTRQGTCHVVENCGMEDEKVYSHLEDLPQEGGYLTTTIIKDRGLDRS